MSRDAAVPVHPLIAYMQRHGFEQDWSAYAATLPSKPAPESIRHIAKGYRPPGWNLAFEMEANSIKGELNAHDLKDPRWYPHENRKAG